MGELRRRGVRRLHASYLPTKKNGMVSEHFDRLGLARVSEAPDGARQYEASVDAYVSPSLPMKIDSTL
jgi:predicted enzyme involved in methoxymalonyl-ACP biosynthesis